MGADDITIASVVLLRVASAIIFPRAVNDPITEYLYEVCYPNNPNEKPAPRRDLRRCQLTFSLRTILLHGENLLDQRYHGN
jgi:hypothetical protein